MTASPHPNTTFDLKDREFPAPLASLTTGNPLVSATRFAVGLIRTRPVDAILLVGDLTHQGDTAGYQKCVDYLVDVILGEWCKSNGAAVCVPGNHDINRPAISPSTTVSQMWAKFEPLEAAWKKHNLPILVTSAIKSLPLKKGPAIADIIALNSCLGCGEYRGLPADLRIAAEKLINGTATADEKWEAIEQIDSPAFALDHIEATQQQIAGDQKVNVLLAHHNLLPQATPRAALYAELLNGGQFRSMLSDAKCPSLYCHGHIHDDPIEIVSLPHKRSAPLVSVGATKLDQGFNIIDLSYTDAGIPLGATVQKYKIGRSHTFSPHPHEEVRIPFRSSAEYFPLYKPPRSDMVALIRSEDGARFPGLLSKLSLVHPALTEAELATMLEEAEWYGIVTILDRELSPPSWQIIRASL